ncbi:palindromic element RPE4 domain-containing protein [Rickettsia tamurae]
MDRKTRSMSYRGLTTVSRKTTKNTNNFSIFN